MKLFLSIARGSLLVAVAISAPTAFAEGVADSQIKASLAKEMLYGTSPASGYKWNQAASSQPQPEALLLQQPIESTRQTYVAASEFENERGAGRAVADQSAYKWGIRSTAEQNAYKWGIRSAAEQNAYKWGIRSAAEQNAYKWGIRSAAEQNAYKWGIRSAAEQNAYKWGIRSAAEQNAYKWGIR